MTDIFGYVIQGLFTGIGAGAAMWFNERHLRKKLDQVDNSITNMKNRGKNAD